MYKANAFLVLVILISAIGLSIIHGPISPMGNTPPVADAGPDQTVDVSEVVHFDGSGSYDPDGLLEIGANIQVNDLGAGSGWQTSPVIGADDSGNVFAAWEDYRDGTYDIYFSRFPSGGTGFGTDIKVNDDVGSARQSRPSMAIGSDGKIHVAWEDYRNNNWDIYYANSSDVGLSFGSNVLASNENTTEWQNNPSIAVDSFGATHVVWEDNREGAWNIFYANSSDGFGRNVKVNDDLLEGNHWDASIAVGSNGVIHVVWEAHTDIYYARSTDGGLSFNSTGRINDDVGGATQGSASMVVEDGGRIHVVWEDSRNVDADIYYARSTDDGLTFEPNIRINTDASGQGQTSPWIDFEQGGPIHIVWADYRFVGHWDIFYSVSFDGGMNFQYNEKVNDDYDPLNRIWQVRPTVAAQDGGYFHAAWKDARKRPAGLLYDVFYVKGKVSTLSYEWNFGDGSPPETSVKLTHIYSLTGIYNVTLTVTDEQNASDTDICVIIVQQRDQPPVADADGPYYANEGSPVTLNAGASYDPDGDPLQYRWDLDNDGTWDTGWSISPYHNHTWGDDYSGDIVLEVWDGEFTDTDNATVVVRNLVPTVEAIEAYIDVNFTLRVAGEKWHNVEMYIYKEGVEIGYAEVVRTPSNPDKQSVTVSDIRCEFPESITVSVLYTPDDDPVNGQPNGADPAWIILTFEDGTNATLNHTFNVRHPETWEWNADINPHFVGHEITFEASASDPGSDDLSFVWDWGDGTPAGITTYYNDGTAPDPYPSPDVNPITASDVQKHAYMAAGAYTLILTVEDDDGGATTTSFDLTF